MTPHTHLIHPQPPARMQHQSFYDTTQTQTPATFNIYNMLLKVFSYIVFMEPEQ